MLVGGGEANCEGWGHYVEAIAAWWGEGWGSPEHCGRVPSMLLTDTDDRTSGWRDEAMAPEINKHLLTKLIKQTKML